jgi:hypothetical protein
MFYNFKMRLLWEEQYFMFLAVNANPTLLDYVISAHLVKILLLLLYFFFFQLSKAEQRP